MRSGIYKGIILTLATILIISIFSSCSHQTNKTTAAGEQATAVISDNISIGQSQASTSSSTEEFTANGVINNNDLNTDYDENSSAVITLDDNNSTVSGVGASVSGNTINVTADGTYIISGTLSNGRIIVNTTDSADVHLILRNAVISCSDYAPISVINADNVYITLDEGSENTVSDGAIYTLSDSSDTTDAAIFSKADLTINGNGTLKVSGNYSHGICSKDDLVITGGTYNITTASSGIVGKDSVSISSGSFYITAGTNAIKTTNEDDADKGDINIFGGSFNITAKTDGIEAQKDLNISGGTFNINTGGGSQNSSTSNGGSWGFWGNTASNDETSASAKGLKADGNINITDGTINIDSSDDSIHSNTSVTLSGGSINLSSGDDGVHANESLIIEGGAINVSKSYEGLEGLSVTISGGTIYVNASDDGINSAGGSDTADASRPGRNPFVSSSSSDSRIAITGGYTVVNASGDGLDSNGTLSISDGIVLVSGPTDNGNSALDYELSADVSGGYVVCAGSPGMALGFGSGSAQCSMCCTLDSAISGGTNVALLDSEGNVLVSFSPEKDYSNIVLSSPAITTGSSYTIQTGGTPSKADSNGFANGGTYSSGNIVAEITQSSVVYSDNSGGMGAMGGGRR